MIFGHFLFEGDQDHHRGGSWPTYHLYGLGVDLLTVFMKFWHFLFEGFRTTPVAHDLHIIWCLFTWENRVYIWFRGGDLNRLIRYLCTSCSKRVRTSPGLITYILFDASWDKEQENIWFSDQVSNRFLDIWSFPIHESLGMTPGVISHILLVTANIWFWRPYDIISDRFQVMTIFNRVYNFSYRILC